MIISLKKKWFNIGLLFVFVLLIIQGKCKCVLDNTKKNSALNDAMIK